MHDAAHAAHFLTSARATRAAMDQHRHRRAVTGGFLRAVAVHDQHAAVIAAGTHDHLAREVVVAGEDRTDKAALAACGEFDDIIDAVVGHHGGNRTEGLDFVHNARALRIGTVKQQRRQEGARFGIGTCHREISRIAENEFGSRAQRADGLAYFIALATAGERAHGHAFLRGIADHDLREPGLQCIKHGRHLRARHEGASDRRAFLAAFGRHLADDFLDVEIELRRARHGIGAEDGAVQRVRFHREAHGVAHDGRMAAQLAAGRGRAGEGHDILAGHVIKQIADAAADELERTFRKDL